MVLVLYTNLSYGVYTVQGGVDLGEVGLHPLFVGVDWVWDDSGTWMEPYNHRVRRNASFPLAGLYLPRVVLALRAAHPINDKPM